MADDIEGKGFIIKDRRRFSEEGEKKEASPEEKPQEPGLEKEISPEEKATQEEQKAEETPLQGQKGDHGQDREPLKVDFTGFVFSLYTSAAFHFGDMADPATGKKEKNLVAAKQMIDIMAMLEEKTRGNLTDDEKNTMDALLYELRMRFVKES